MTPKTIALLLSLLALSLFFPVMARADLTVAVTNSIDLSKLTYQGKPIPQKMKQQIMKALYQQLGDIANGEYAVYCSGSKKKLVARKFTYITDLDQISTAVCDPVSRTYTVYTLTAPASPLDSASIVQKDLGYNKTLLKQNTHLSRIYFSYGPAAITVYCWLADNITDLNKFDAAFKSLYGRLGIVGYPVKLSCNIKMQGLGGAIIMKQDTASLSTDPVDPSVFQIPADYTQVKPAPEQAN